MAIPRPSLGDARRQIEPPYAPGAEDERVEHSRVRWGHRTPIEAILDSTRALLWIRTPADAVAVAADLVALLGGTVLPAQDDTGDAVPIDISFGVGQPTLPHAPRSSEARAALERHLPAFVSDAHRALELVDQSARLVEDASIDALTGLANRRMLGRRLGRLRPEETVVMIDLDHFKVVNDTLGHQAGDAVLRALGQTLAATLRASDRAGRYGGEEFVVILTEGEPDAFLTRLREGWAKARPHPITFSAGVAPCRPDPQRALKAADRAMYRAKAAGRDQWHTATEDDYS